MILGQLGRRVHVSDTVQRVAESAAAAYKQRLSWLGANTRPAWLVCCVAQSSRLVVLFVCVLSCVGVCVVWAFGQQEAPPS